MKSRVSGCVIVFNGELYNADELRRELEPHRVFVSHADTEVVLAAYDRWGPDACGRLHGMFALAVWDPGNGFMLLARDPLGVKPLYFGHDGCQLIFASELRSVLAGRARQPQLSLAALERYLATGGVEEPKTIVEGIEMVPAGTRLLFRAGRLTSHVFWSLPEQFADPLPSLTPIDARDMVRSALESAVRRQLVSDVPRGVFLSGGVDSSALVGLTSVVDRPPTTASVVFREAMYSEAKFIRSVTERWATDHREVELSDAGFLARLPDAIGAMDQPTVDGVNAYVVAQLARQSGLTVALSGVGGDELFGGYDTFRSVPRLEHLRRRCPRLPSPLAHAVARLRFGVGDRANKFGRWLSGERLSAYALQREVIEPRLRAQLLRGGAYPSVEMLEQRANDPNDVSRLELSHYMRNVLLRDTDVMSMAHGLEVRVPFLDQSVVELVARLPSEHKFAPGRQKPLLVDAVRDLLPAPVIDRPKMGFTLPFESWLRGSLRNDVRDVLLDSAAGGQVAGALAPDAIAEVWRRFERQETSWSRPWVLYIAKKWGERHL